MTDPMIRAQGRGLLQGVLNQAIGVAIAFVLFVIAAVVAAVLPLEDSERIIAWAITVGLLFTAFVLGAITFTMRRTRALDPAFSALGLTPSGSLPNLREYHGTLGSRRVDALFARRGPVLEVHVSTPLHTTLAVGTRTALGALVRDAVGATEVPHNDPALAQFVVTADDPAWARAALSDPAFRDAVLRAVADPSGRELRVLALRPGAVRLTRRYFDPDAIAHEIKPMVEHVGALAMAVERLPPPARAVPLTPFERRVREGGSNKLALAIVLGTLVVCLMAGLCAVGMMFAMNAGDAGAPRRGRVR